MTLRTAVPADLPDLRRVFRAASLSNPRDVPLFSAHPEFLHFTGDADVDGRTRVAQEGSQGQDKILGFATVTHGHNDDGELEDLFVDPRWHLCGVAQILIVDAVAALRASGHRRLWVDGNPQALAFYRAVGFIGEDRVATGRTAGIRLHLDL